MQYLAKLATLVIIIHVSKISTHFQFDTALVPKLLFQQTAVSTEYLLKATMCSSYWHFNWKQIIFRLLLVASPEAQAYAHPTSCPVVCLLLTSGKPQTIWKFSFSNQLEGSLTVKILVAFLGKSCLHLTPLYSLKWTSVHICTKSINI